MATLLDLADDDRIALHLESPRATVQPHDDQEHVALTAIRNDLLDVPVTDAEGRFLGAVPALALLRVLHQEHVEDFDRLSGVLRRTEQAARALDEPPTRRMRERLPWLVVGLAGSAIATWIMSAFEAAIERRLAVAFFVPGIVYMADAIGTQTEAIAVRGLSFRQFENRRHLLLQELGTGCLLGLAFGAPVFPAVWWIFGDIRLAVAVALAVVLAGTIVTAVGLAFPMLLLRLGKRPGPRERPSRDGRARRAELGHLFRGGTGATARLTAIHARAVGAEPAQMTRSIAGVPRLAGVALAVEAPIP